MKKLLVDAGFEVFRTRGDEIVLAERVRENLIMDSGVRLRMGPPFQVRVVMRAQRNDFPNAHEDDLFDRVREVAGPALRDGYVEVGQTVAPVKDPADPERTLDTFYEVMFARDEAELPQALERLHQAFAFEKAATPRRTD